MKVLELRIIDDKYTIVTDGRASSTTFDTKFRAMAVNKFKFVTKNTPTPFKVIVEDAQGKEIVNKEITNLSDIDTIR